MLNFRELENRPTEVALISVRTWTPTEVSADRVALCQVKFETRDVAVRRPSSCCRAVVVLGSRCTAPWSSVGGHLPWSRCVGAPPLLYSGRPPRATPERLIFV
jgi:hypothetical protein